MIWIRVPTPRRGPVTFKELSGRIHPENLDRVGTAFETAEYLED